MTIENSPKINSIREQHTLALGDLYFFDHFLIAEFKEGVNIDFDNFKEASLLIRQFYGDRPIGFVSNRVNSYSINLTEAEKFNNAYPNLKAHAVVAYSTLSEKIYEIENHFFKFKRELFHDIDEAIEWVEHILNSEVHS